MYFIPVSFTSLNFAPRAKIGGVLYIETESGVKLKVSSRNVVASRPGADRPAEMTAIRPPVEVPRASSYTPRVSMARFARVCRSLAAGPRTAHLELGSRRLDGRIEMGVGNGRQYDFEGS